MAIDVNVAKIRAGQLLQYKVWLENSRRKMCEYKSQVSNNWSGEEMVPVNLAMSQVISALDKVLSELDSAGDDIVRIANAIRTEEMEAERQRKIQEASGQINRFNKELEQLYRQRKEIERNLETGSNQQLEKELGLIVEKIKTAKKNSSNWQNHLNSLRR